MTVLITLTLAGSDTGPFDIYSNSDGYTTPIATGVSKAALEAGYSLAGVPDDAAVIRAQSTGTCTNYLDMYLSGGTTTTTSSTSSTTTTTTTLAACLTGDTSAVASCSGGESALFTVTAGNTAVITPGGYYYSGSGTRTYTAYIMNAANDTVLYTFAYTQTGSSPGVWTSDLLSNILPAGSYRLRTDTVNCFSSSGSFSLTATCSDGYYYYDVQRYDCELGCEPGTTAIARNTNFMTIGYFYKDGDGFVYEILNVTGGSYYNVDLYGAPSSSTCSAACEA